MLNIFVSAQELPGKANTYLKLDGIKAVKLDLEDVSPQAAIIIKEIQKIKKKTIDNNYKKFSAISQKFISLNKQLLKLNKIAQKLSSYNNAGNKAIKVEISQLYNHLKINMANKRQQLIREQAEKRQKFKVKIEFYNDEDKSKILKYYDKSGRDILANINDLFELNMHRIKTTFKKLSSLKH